MSFEARAAFGQPPLVPFSKSDYTFGNGYPFGSEIVIQVAKWGNSLAGRLPARLVREHALKEGDRVELHPAAAGLAVRRQPRP